MLSSAQFPRFLMNSALLSAIGAFGALLVAAPAAYAFSRMDFHGRKALLLGVLALQMISPLVLAFPLYRYFASLGLLDSLPATGLVYIAVLMPLATWMLKGFFDGIPRELDEAAMIDGASRFSAFVRVVLPVARSGPDRGVRHHRAARLGGVRDPVHPAERAAAHADLGRHPQLPGDLRDELDRHPRGRAACSRCCPRSCSSWCCSASSSARSCRAR